MLPLWRSYGLRLSVLKFINLARRRHKGHWCHFTSTLYWLRYRDNLLFEMLRTYFLVTAEQKKSVAGSLSSFPAFKRKKKKKLKKKKKPAVMETIVEINEEWRSLANPGLVIISLQRSQREPINL